MRKSVNSIQTRLNLLGPDPSRTTRDSDMVEDEEELPIPYVDLDVHSHCANPRCSVDNPLASRYYVDDDGEYVCDKCFIRQRMTKMNKLLPRYRRLYNQLQRRWPMLEMVLNRAHEDIARRNRRNGDDSANQLPASAQSLGDEPNPAA